MPLLVNNKPVDKNVSLEDIMKNFRDSSKTLCKQEIRAVGPKGLLYVGQREMGATSPEDDTISVLGTDDATTCHMAVLRHSGSGATCIVHFDGCNTRQGLDSMVESVQELSKGKSGQLDLHLVGGFDDDRGHSKKLTVELVDNLRQLQTNIHLQTACLTEVNTELRNGEPFPVFYGLAVHVKTGEIFKASFVDKGPDLPLRGARHFTGGHDIMNIYDPKTKLMKFEPFTYNQLSNIDRLCQAPDSFIRQNLSTSPTQEPKHFEATVRASLYQIRDHPQPLSTMFKGGKARCYKKQDSGTWETV